MSLSTSPSALPSSLIQPDLGLCNYRYYSRSPAGKYVLSMRNRLGVDLVDIVKMRRGRKGIRALLMSSVDVGNFGGYWGGTRMMRSLGGLSGPASESPCTVEAKDAMGHTLICDSAFARSNLAFRSRCSVFSLATRLPCQPCPS